MKIPLRSPTDPLLSSHHSLPTMYDLPSEDPEEPGLPDIFHELQPQILQLTFKPQGWQREKVFGATDLNLYYDLNHPLWHKRPDWFGVVGVDEFYEQRDLRLSYVIWQEKVSPLVVVELLSPGTEAEDLGETASQIGQPPTKWQVYEQILKIPYYAIFSRYTNELRAFQLVEGYYQPVDVSHGYLLVPEIGLRLGLWRGKYRHCRRLWLRWMSLEGELILLPEEESEIAKQQATEAKQQATEAKQQATEAKQQATEAKQELLEVQKRADQLAAKLRELGINPDVL